MTDTTDKVAFAAAELLAASEALASAAAEVDALRAELARQTGIAVDHCARADAAERMVAELRDVVGTEIERMLSDYYKKQKPDGYHGSPQTYAIEQGCNAIDAALANTAEVAGRWVSMDAAYKREKDANARADRLLARVREVETERDAAIAARDEAVAQVQQMRRGLDTAVGDIDDAVDDWMQKTAAAERARDEVGIQLAAAQAEIARMRPVVEAARPLAKILPGAGVLRDAIRALDAVPGDALAPRITAALDASGIDSANVKGVE